MSYTFETSNKVCTWVDTYFLRVHMFAIVQYTDKQRLFLNCTLVNEPNITLAAQMTELKLKFASTFMLCQNVNTCTNPWRPNPSLHTMDSMRPSGPSQK